MPSGQYVSGLIPNGLHQRKREKGVSLLGQDLRDHREETFCRMVCDGLGLGLAFKNAGFTSTDNNAPSNLWNLDRIQQRAAAILEARATQGVVTLPEVTDMLQRVFTGALHRDEYSAAHNAAFSLARLYGHVTDKSTVEVIRRPSRDPDAPSEQALASWVNSLPIIDHAPDGSIGAFHDAPADLLGTPATNLATVAVSSPTVASSSPTAADNLAAVASDLAAVADPVADATHSHLGQRGKPSDFNDLELCSLSVQAGGRSENGAPAPPVTGTPDSGAHADPSRPGWGSEKEAPLPNRQVPGTPAASCATEYPPAEELF